MPKRSGAPASATTACRSTRTTCEGATPPPARDRRPASSGRRPPRGPRGRVLSAPPRRGDGALGDLAEVGEPPQRRVAQRQGGAAVVQEVARVGLELGHLLPRRGDGGGVLLVDRRLL